MWKRGGWLHYCLVGAAIFAGLFALLPAGELIDVQGDTKERAEVIAVRAHPGVDNCSTRRSEPRPNRAITWRSVNPPDGMDETFVQIEACSVPYVGEVFTVYRIGGEPGNVLVRVNPADSVGDLISFAGFGAGIGVVIGLIYFGIDRFRDPWAKWRAERPGWWRFRL